jgi:hypothetical protein
VRRGIAGLLGIVMLTAAGGCTMCPDPFDYSGPVPNGSPPHNDFCARSNGILPLNAAPSPWPPVVDGEHDRGLPVPLPEEDGGAVTAGAVEEVYSAAGATP